MLSRLIVLAGALLCSAPARAGDSVVALLSYDGGAYLEAFSAFQAAYGSEVRRYDVSRRPAVLPPGARTLVAFGGKAARQELPPGVNIVYCMAPGLFVKQQDAGARVVKVSLIPNFDVTLAEIRKIQPGLRRLRIFWMMPELGRFSEMVRTEGQKYGIEVTDVGLGDTGELPGLLRRSMGQTDAIWLPPDPLLISAETIMMLREFSWGSAIPFYASSKGLARDGATASVGVSFANMGATAAEAVRQIEAGGDPAPIMFPHKLELALNASAAKKCRLQFPPDVLREADYLYP